MKKISIALATFMFAVMGVATTAPVATVAAYNPLDGACSGGSKSEVCTNRKESVEPIVGTVVNVLLFIVGTISVIMVIFAGIMYTISGGDSGRVAKAKNMLIYAIVGLIVSFLAFALVNWVFNLFK